MTFPDQAGGQPLIDVLIPAYNAEATVRAAVGSIQAQDLRALSIVVVDDGSSDGTPEILAELAAGDARIRVLTQPNGGIVSALNAGLALCRAAIVARHDADDLAAPDRLSRQLAYLEANPDCIAVGCACRHIDEAGRDLGTVAHFEDPARADATLVPALEPYLIHPFLMARRASLEAVGGYRFVYHAEDTDLYWRLQETGRLHNMDDVLGDYRMHEASISGSSLANARMMALSSQLCALSATRRRAGRADLDFPADAIPAYRAASGSLQGLHAVATPGLTEAEARHLGFAMAAKLLELAAYRPYELEVEDCRYARAAYREGCAALTPENRRFLKRQYSGAAARLAHQGRWNEARLLTFPETAAASAVRYLLRVLLSPDVRLRIKRALGMKV